MKKLSVNLIDKACDDLVDVMVLDRATQTDSVNRSIQVYAFLLRQLVSGKKIVLQDEDGDTETLTII